MEIENINPTPNGHSNLLFYIHGKSLVWTGWKVIYYLVIYDNILDYFYSKNQTSNATGLKSIRLMAIEFCTNTIRLTSGTNLFKVHNKETVKLYQN